MITIIDLIKRLYAWLFNIVNDTIEDAIVFILTGVVISICIFMVFASMAGCHMLFKYLTKL